MSAFYGLRREEILGLRWQDVDFEENVFTITHTVTQTREDGKTRIIRKDRTKNRASCRSMPLVPEYRELLLRMKKRQENCRLLCGNCYEESDYIWVNDLGVPYKPEYVSTHFKLLLQKNGLRHIRFHDLRHPYVKHTTKKYNSEKQKTQATKIEDLIAWGFCFCIVSYSKRSWTL